MQDLVFVPKHFFVPDIIEKRKPLSPNTRRAGWVGCNINLSKIPEQGRITIIANGFAENAESVIGKVATSCRLEIGEINSRGWIMDILNCINSIPNTRFTLNEVYSFESMLSMKHPQNNNIRPKIRQQLQLLRDRGFIEFIGNGEYKKIK